MARGTRAASRLANWLAVAVILAGCGQGPTAPGTAGDSAATTPATRTEPPPSAPAETPEATASTSSRPAAASPSATFESPLYRYAITLPAGSMLLNWRPAQRKWDGSSKIDRAGPHTDRTAIAEGGLYLFGAEAESLESWFERVAANGARYHGCTPGDNRVDVTINGVPAIAFTQSCDENTNMARVALWKDGYGIGVWLGETSVDKLVAVRDRAVELLSTLEWQGS
jgi:hypothetical protein